MCYAGSSEALLAGQKPPFRLLVRAMSRDSGARLSNIRFAVSEPFVVSTCDLPSSALKAVRPHPCREAFSESAGMRHIQLLRKLCQG